MISGPSDPKSSQAQPSWVVGPPVPAVARLGQLIDGEFLIKGILGQGELGVTYEADNTRLKRRFAVLILSRELRPTHAMMLAVRDDLRRAQQLTSAGIMPVKLIADREGIPGFATELLEGETLRSRLARGPLRAERALAVILSVAHTLEAAHKVGLVHGDLRPENIFLVRPGAKSASAGKAMVVEHALHHLRRRTPGLDDRLPLYKLMYRPPEQVMGLAGATEQGDVWVLSAILYECLTGKPAFYAEEPEFVLDNLGNLPPELDGNPAIGMSEELATSINVLIASACTRDLDSRVPNMSEFIEGLEQIVAGSGLKLPEVVAETREEAAAVLQPIAPANKKMNRVLQRLSGVFPQIQLPNAGNSSPNETPVAVAPTPDPATGLKPVPKQAMIEPQSIPKLQPIVPPKERVNKILQKLSGAFPVITGPPPDLDDEPVPLQDEPAAKSGAVAPVPAAAPAEEPAPAIDELPTPKLSDLDRAMDVLKRAKAQGAAPVAPVDQAAPKPTLSAPAPSERATVPPVEATASEALPPKNTPAAAPAPAAAPERPTFPPVEAAPPAEPVPATAPAKVSHDALTMPLLNALQLKPTPPAKVEEEPALPEPQAPAPMVEASSQSAKTPPIAPAAPVSQSAKTPPLEPLTPVKPSELPLSNRTPPLPALGRVMEPASSAKSGRVMEPAPSGKSGRVMEPAPSGKSGRLGEPAPSAKSSKQAAPVEEKQPEAVKAPPVPSTRTPPIPSTKTPPIGRVQEAPASTRTPAIAQPPKAPEPPAAAQTPVPPPSAKSGRPPLPPPAETRPIETESKSAEPAVAPRTGEEPTGPSIVADLATVKPRDVSLSSAETPKSPLLAAKSAAHRPSAIALESTLAPEELAEIMDPSSPAFTVPPVASPTPASDEAPAVDDKAPQTPKTLSDLPTRPAMASLVEKLIPLKGPVFPGLNEQSTQPALRRMPITELATQAKLEALPGESGAHAVSPKPAPTDDSSGAITPPIVPAPSEIEPKSTGSQAATSQSAAPVEKQRPRPPRVSQLIAAIQAQQPRPPVPPVPPAAVAAQSSGPTPAGAASGPSPALGTPRRVSPGLMAPAPDMLAPPPSTTSVHSGPHDAALSQSQQLPPGPLTWMLRHQELVAALIGATLVMMVTLIFLLLR